MRAALRRLLRGSGRVDDDVDDEVDADVDDDDVVLLPSATMSAIYYFTSMSLRIPCSAAPSARAKATFARLWE
jgi:hypothetical protein